MANYFKEYGEVIRMQQQELADIGSGVLMLSNVDTDPMFMKVSGVNLTEMTSQGVFEAVWTNAREEEADRNLTMVKNCLDKLNITIRLLEVQDRLSWAGKGMDVAPVQDCLSEDHNVITALTSQLVALKEFQEHNQLPHVIDRESYYGRLNDAMEQYSTLIQKGASERYAAAKEFENAAGLQTLISEVYELRMDYLDAAIEDSAVFIHGMKSKLWEAAYMKVAIDEGVLESNPFIEDKIRENVEYCRKNQSAAAENVGAILRFMGQMYEMGDDNYGTSDFEVREYKPVYLATLPILKP
jgi:hypothetical protein